MNQQKSAIVTGAGGTLGSLAVAKLLERGCSVLAVDNSEAALESLASSHPESGLTTFVAEVTRREDVAAYAHRAGELFTEKVDFFFNNAGIEGHVSRLRDTDPADFTRVIDVNVNGVLHGMAEVLPIMKRGGSIVNMGSTASLAGAEGMGAYVAAKHAVLGLTRTAAIEEAGQGIRVNVVCPTAVQGPMMRSIDAQRVQHLGSAPSDDARFITPESVIDVVLFLFSEGSRAINGQSILVGKAVA